MPELLELLEVGVGGVGVVGSGVTMIGTSSVLREEEWVTVVW